MKKEEITILLREYKNGSEDAYNKLFPLVCDELKLKAFKELLHERDNHTFSKTDLVHEVYLKMFNQNETNEPEPGYNRMNSISWLQRIN